MNSAKKCLLYHQPNRHLVGRRFANEDSPMANEKPRSEDIGLSSIGKTPETAATMQAQHQQEDRARPNSWLMPRASPETNAREVSSPPARSTMSPKTQSALGRTHSRSRTLSNHVARLEQETRRTNLSEDLLEELIARWYGRV